MIFSMLISVAFYLKNMRGRNRVVFPFKGYWTPVYFGALSCEKALCYAHSEVVIFVRRPRNFLRPLLKCWNRMWIFVRRNCRETGELQGNRGITGKQGNYRETAELQVFSGTFQTHAKLQFNRHKLQDSSAF